MSNGRTVTGGSLAVASAARNKNENNKTNNSKDCSHFGSREFRIVLLFFRVPPTPMLQKKAVEAEFALDGKTSFASTTKRPKASKG